MGLPAWSLTVTCSDELLPANARAPASEIQPGRFFSSIRTDEVWPPMTIKSRPNDRDYGRTAGPTRQSLEPEADRDAVRVSEVAVGQEGVVQGKALHAQA